MGPTLLVLNTVIQNIPKDDTREWGPRANPQTAVLGYMLGRKDFENDANIKQRIGITVATKGFWIKVQEVQKHSIPQQHLHYVVEVPLRFVLGGEVQNSCKGEFFARIGMKSYAA